MASGVRKEKRPPPAARGGAPRLDATHLAGITALMNPQNVRPGTNLAEAEKAIMGRPSAAGPRARPAEADPVRLYTDELNRLAGELGIDLLDGAAAAAPAPAAAPAKPPPGAPPAQGGGPAARGAGPMRSRIAELIDELDFDSRSTRSGGSRAASQAASRAASRAPKASSRARDEVSDDAASSGASDEASSDASECDCDSDCDDDCDCGCHEEDECDDSDCECECHKEIECDCPEECPDSCGCECHAEVECHDGCECACHEEEDDDDEEDEAQAGRALDNFESELGLRPEPARAHRHRDPQQYAAAAQPRSRRAPESSEQEQRRHIDSVVRGIRDETHTPMGADRERLQDIKSSKIAQIGQLRLALEEEGIDCSSVASPDHNSPMEEIDGALGILRLKNDRNRYSSMAEEVLIGAAEFVETVFDGEREIPLLGWRPDYTGYSSTVNCKLHRMRFETSQVVGDIIQKYSFGPTTRIILELLPSFFLYPRQQRKQRGRPGLASDLRVADARQALASIHAADSTLDDVRRL